MESYVVINVPQLLPKFNDYNILGKDERANFLLYKAFTETFGHCIGILVRLSTQGDFGVPRGFWRVDDFVPQKREALDPRPKRDGETRLAMAGADVMGPPRDSTKSCWSDLSDSAHQKC